MSTVRPSVRALAALVPLLTAHPAAVLADPSHPPASPAAPAPGYLGAQLDAAPDGVRVVSTVPNAPGARAGLLAGDVVTHIRGVPVRAVPEFIAAVRAAGANNTLRLELHRGTRRISLDVHLATAPRTGVTVGEAPPELHATLAMGPGPTDLAQLRGRVVVLDFWATWCQPCRDAMPALNRMHHRYAAQGLSVLGVTDETVADARQAGASMGIEYTLASEPTAVQRFHVTGLPTLVVLDRAGIVRHISVGADADELRVVDGVVSQLLGSHTP